MSESRRESQARLPVLLVIDDVPGVCASIRVMLMNRYEIVSATQIGEAIEVIRGTAAIDAVLCDMQMSGSTVEDLQREIGAARPALARRLLLMTGGAFPHDEPGVAQVPSSLRLLKPFSTEHLVKALASVDVPPAPSPRKPAG